MAEATATSSGGGGGGGSNAASQALGRLNNLLVGNAAGAALYAKARDLLVALFVVMTLVIMIYPLSPMVMDFLLAGNITLSLLLLLATVYVQRPIDLSIFPSLLLVATLYRLSLNIATTRLILSNAPSQGDQAAGEIISAFGTFVAGGTGGDFNSIAIGIVIFVILVIIQFVVITKGATRIAEVAARFTLDAMPGQQMAIDADLNAGLIDEVEAKTRREELRQLTDFYGAMDGASKFVRGDAIAGIIITLVNIAAGLIIGTSLSTPAMTLSDAAQVFTALTIGDGLVSQIPALLVSIASGLIVTRSASRANFGEEVIGQLFGQAKILYIAAGILGSLGLSGILGITPFPSFPLLSLALVCGINGWNLSRGRPAKAGAGSAAGAEGEAAEGEGAKAGEASAAAKPEDYLKIDPMELEVGYGLVPLVDTGQAEAGGGGLLSRIQMMRQQMAQEMGIIVPPIRIRDNIQLGANEYVIKIQGMDVARGTAEPDRYLAMDSGMATEAVEGITTVEPAFGLPAVWITEANREYAERVGYTVVDAETVVATHINEVIKSRSHELLTREEVRRLLDAVRENAPNLVQETVPDLMTISDVQKVLQNLLRERISIRNLPAILETLGDMARRTKDPEILTEYCRNKLARQLCNDYAEDGKLHVVALDPRLEEGIARRVEHTDAGGFLSLRPPQQQKVVEAIEAEVAKQLQNGHSALVLTGPQIRMHVKRMIEGRMPMVAVMSYNEVLSDFQVVSEGMVSVEL